MTPQKFKKIVLGHYQNYRRHDLPWRQTENPYRILVSEIMLQQTQVERVVPYYRAFLKKFPTVKALAAAPLGEVLKSWQGLGYNRRAKMLHEAAKQIMTAHKGRFPKKVAELETLRGVGPYTARAVAAFAYNQDVIFVETNIRTAIIHHFFSSSDKKITSIYGSKKCKEKKVTDEEIVTVLEIILPRGRSREWYSALMDYGAALKSQGVRLNKKSTTYAKQSKFAGSAREARGAILRALATGEKTAAMLLNILGVKRREQVREQIKKLAAEGLITKRGRTYHLPH